jgi:hypothetical protein
MVIDANVNGNAIYFSWKWDKNGLVIKHGLSTLRKPGLALDTIIN